MIYKCKNCGKNYGTKPDFCECGNNTFVSINQNYNTHSANQDTSIIQTKNLQHNNSYNNSQNKNNRLVIPSFVLILSVLFFIFAIYKSYSYHPQILPQTTKKTEPVSITPNINEYWIDEANNTNSVALTNNSQDNFQSSQNFSDIFFEPINTKKNKDKNINSVIKPKTKTEEKSNIINNKETAIKNSDSVKETNIAIQKPHNEEKTNIKLTQNSSNTDSVTKIDRSQGDIKEQKENNETKSSDDSKNGDISEISKYKAELRQQLFRYFPVLNVQGKGSAQIGFSIADDGKLLDRRFVQLSDNKSLNDALYHMLMCVPSYKIPPQNYNHEEIILKMDFDNGYYSFSFVN